MSFLSQALLQYVRPEGDSAYYTIPATQDAQPRGANTVPGLVFNGAVPRVQREGVNYGHGASDRTGGAA